MTRKERLFVYYYLGKAKANGSLAARLAGYRKNPANAAYTLLIKGYIREAVESKLEEIAMSQEEVLIRLSDRAASSAEDFVTFSVKGSPNALPSLDLKRAKRRGQLGNVKKLKVKRTPGDNPLEIVEVEIHDALPALALLMRYYGMDEKKAGTGNGTADAIRELLGRPRTPRGDS